MTIAKPLILCGVFSVVPAAALAQSETPDLSKWQCNLCKFENSAGGSIEAGVGDVSDRSAKFGDYTGRNEKGAYLIGGAEARARRTDGTYWNVRASDIGLDSRSAALEGGRQGQYRLFLHSDSIPHYLSDTVQTPFLGAGSRIQGLPAGFPAGTTGLMPLATTLQSLRVETERQRIGLGGSWIPASGWQTDVSYRRESRVGSKRSAGSFFINAAQLLEPVDTVTEQVDASVTYATSRLQARFAYYGSRFRNDIDALTWQNPFTVPGFATAVTGQLGSPPDSQFHQLSASIGYQISDRTRASGEIAWGRMTQNDAFLAPTLNAALAVPALPGSSLDAHGKTLNASLRVTSRLTDLLRVSASYTRDERDNQTRQAVYPWVTTDMFLAAPRTNLPYSFTRDKLKLSADYRVSSKLKATAGVDQEWRKYTFHEFRKTNETSVWGKAGVRATDRLELSLRVSAGERRNSGYQVVDVVVPPENPRLRTYTLANRSRESVRVGADFAATDKIQLGLGVESSNDRYEDTAIGLTSGKELSLHGDLAVLFTEQTSLHAFANRQTIKSTQAGSQAFAAPDWTTENKDRVNVLGLGIKHAAIKDKLDIGADYAWTRTRGAIRVTTGAAEPGFPNLTTSLTSLRLYAHYRVDAHWSLRGGYWAEKYDSDNWALDGVLPGTVPNVLTFGEQTPRYRVHVLRLSARYDF